MKKLVVFCLTGLILLSCEKEDANTDYYVFDPTNEEVNKDTVPVVSITVFAPSFTTESSVEVSGTINPDGEEIIIERGVVYGHSPNPTKYDYHIEDTSVNNSVFTVTLTDLTGRIYYRGYAINDTEKVFYSTEFSVLIYSAGSGVTDFDGNTYGSVIINNHEWMTENLKVTHYADGTVIPNVTRDTDWPPHNKYNVKAYCWYNNNEMYYKDLYGGLYTWAAATNGNYSGIDVQGVCPTGWRLPDEDDWDSLIEAVGGADVAGGILKATTGWDDDGNGTDDIGFSALPAGFRYRYIGGSFWYGGERGYWWSATESSDEYAKDREIYSYSNRVGYSWSSSSSSLKAHGSSVRCVKDIEQ